MKLRWMTCLLAAGVVAMAVVPSRGQSLERFMDALEERFDPSSRRRPPAPPKEAPAGEQPPDKPAPTSPAPPRPPRPSAPPPSPFIDQTPEAEHYTDRVRQLETVTPETVRPVRSMDEAEARIADLQTRADAMTLRADRRTMEAVDQVKDDATKVRDRWTPVVDALGDGKDRSAGEWGKLVKDAREGRLAVEPPPARPDLVEEADEEVGVPQPRGLTSFEKAFESPKPKKPLEPVEPPKEPDFKAADLSDLREALESADKPASMHPATWAQLLDAVEKDLADLAVTVAQTQEDLKERRADELDPLARAIQAAQDLYRRLSEQEGDLTPEQRRELAWRLHQARLESLRLALADVQALQLERSGRTSGREPMIQIGPGTPADVLIDIARALSAEGIPGHEFFDAMTMEGLPPLYPPGSNTIVDDKVHWLNLARADRDRHLRELRDLRHKMANADKDLAREDYETARLRYADMLQEDKLAGKVDDPIERARRRVATLELLKKLNSSRPERLEVRKKELQAQIDKALQKIEAEQARIDDMLKAAADLEPRPAPSTQPDGN